MSRISYSEDEDYPGEFELWQANCRRSLQSKAGQAELRALRDALLAWLRNVEPRRSRLQKKRSPNRCGSEIESRFSRPSASENFNRVRSRYEELLLLPSAYQRSSVGNAAYGADARWNTLTYRGRV